MKSLRERFDEKWEENPDTGCWEWTASTKNGYGEIRVNGKSVYTHRLSYELHVGSIPEGDGHHGAVVAHHCDNRLCCNPGHIFITDQAGNLSDMRSKGRGYIPQPPRLKGESHGMAKLTEAAVLQIRKYYAAGGCTKKWLAGVYGVSRRNIGMIINNKRWSHI